MSHNHPIHDKIREEAEREAERETEHQENDGEHEHKHYHKTTYFTKLILGLLLAMLIILMVVPYYGIKLNPEPKNIPSLAEVLPSNLQEYVINSTIHVDKNNFFKNVNPNHPIIKQISSKVASQSCPSGNKICQSKAIFYFIRDNINYISDPPNEYIEHPLEVLYTGGSDCDGMAVLLATMEKSIGIEAGFVFVPKHVYTQIYLQQAPKKYKDQDGWISLDATCKQCEFGELSYGVMNQEKEYVKNI